MSTPAARLVFKNKDDAIPIEAMRVHFEQAMKATPMFSEQPLEVEEGEQFAYANTETHCLWNGFALGMRCAERIAKAASAMLSAGEIDG